MNGRDADAAHPGCTDPRLESCPVAEASGRGSYRCTARRMTALHLGTSKIGVALVRAVLMLDPRHDM
jgi:hypothetical protein